MTRTDPDRAYRTAAAFFARLAEGGVAHVVVSPGSRSTPLAVTADATPALTTHVIIDERVAGFFALGLARATGAPVALVCTSGTAAANYLPAVIEANHSRVPLVVCTADRPPELRDRGAGQTVDQVGMYGSNVRWSLDLPVASDVDADFGSTLALRVLHECSGPPGPVHCNWPLREPLAPDRWTPDGAAPSAVAPAPPPAPAPDAGRSPAASARRPLLVVGPGDLAPLGPVVAEVAAALGWPVLAEATSSLRSGPHLAGAPFLAHWDLLVRDLRWLAGDGPDRVIRLGGPPTTKALRLLIERHRVPVTTIDRFGRFDDPTGQLTDTLVGDPAAALTTLAETTPPADGSWCGRWVDADHHLRALVDADLAAHPLLGAGVARAVGEALPAGGSLYVSSSLPVRDVDAHLPLSSKPWRVLANRGAAGIDGVTASAFGFAAAAGPTVLLTGDVAFVHDIGALHAGVRAGIGLTVVVPDNGGGGIFDHLPAAEHPTVDHERLFVAPSTIDWDAVGAIGGVTVHHTDDPEDLRSSVAGSVARPGVDVLVVPVDRQADLAQHRRLAAAIDRLPG